MIPLLLWDAEYTVPPQMYVQLLLLFIFNKQLFCKSVEGKQLTMLGTKTRAMYEAMFGQSVSNMSNKHMHGHGDAKMLQDGVSAERLQTFWSIIQADSSHFCIPLIILRIQKPQTVVSECAALSWDYSCCPLMSRPVVRGSLDDSRRGNLKSASVFSSSAGERSA